MADCKNPGSSRLQNTRKPAPVFCTRAGSVPLYPLSECRHTWIGAGPLTTSPADLLPFCYSLLIPRVLPKNAQQGQVGEPRKHYLQELLPLGRFPPILSLWPAPVHVRRSSYCSRTSGMWKRSWQSSHSTTRSESSSLPKRSYVR